MEGIRPEVSQVIGAVTRLIPPEETELPDEFYPAHLSVALIDAVLGPGGGNEEEADSGAERYCHRFGIERTRADRWDLPLAEQQESLRDLVRRFREFGVEGLARGVFRVGDDCPGTYLARAEHVLLAANELRRIGVEVLQDVWDGRTEDVEDVMLKACPSSRDAARMLLMYTGDDDFVQGDACVRRFVARAIRRETVSMRQAVELVRQSAYELILAPRFLDRAIWKSCSHG